jgi:uncharacterized glyoxalase superfamily metalloenzyme YdcJ
MPSSTELRSRFAAALSELYATEVPAYQQLVDTATQVNATVLRDRPESAERLGSISRVTCERHGAVRVGTPAELHDLGVVLAAFGMQPVDFYDLRDTPASPVPVVSTAFRPVDADELAANPFRLFVSVLVPEDRRFFDAELQAAVERFLAARTLFPPELLVLARRATAEGGLPEDAAAELVRLAVASFQLSQEPIDRAWYERLAAVSSVAADIAGVPSTHINHLTPRVLDIDLLHASMRRQGVDMLERIEGPPRWDGPELLLRQTSFKALAEARTMAEPDGSVVQGALRVRFGEVEARGTALTPAGRDLHDRCLAEADEARRADPALGWQDASRPVWERHFPASEDELQRSGLAHFTWHADGGRLVPRPVVYEDFLPRSAAGIFQSNLTSAGETAAEQGAPRDLGWLSDVLGREVLQSQDVYAEQVRASISSAAAALGRSESEVLAETGSPLGTAVGAPSGR